MIIHSLGLNYWTCTEQRCLMHRGILEGVREHTATLEPGWKFREDGLFPHRTFLKISARYFNQSSDSCGCTVGFLPQCIFIGILFFDTIFITTSYAYIRDFRQTGIYIQNFIYANVKTGIQPNLGD